MIHTLHLKYTYMRKRTSGTKSYLFIQYAAKEVLGIDQTLHVHIRLTVMYLLNRSSCSFNGVLYVNDLIIIQVHGKFIRDGFDLIHITHQDAVRDTLLLCSLHCKKHLIILCNCY